MYITMKPFYFCLSDICKNEAGLSASNKVPPRRSHGCKLICVHYSVTWDLCIFIIRCALQYVSQSVKRVVTRWIAGNQNRVGAGRCFSLLPYPVWYAVLVGGGDICHGNCSRQNLKLRQRK
jgi:hypothetical protein